MKNTDKRLKNLKPWKKGESGNIHGRPKKELCLTDELRKQLNQPCDVDVRNKHGVSIFKGLTWKQAYIKSGLINAVKGNAGISDNIWNRIENKLPQPIGIEITDQMQNYIELMKKLWGEK